MTYAAVAFDRVAHLARVPVIVGGDRFLFLVDSGIGVTVISSAVAERADVDPIDETFSGRRMSGQEIQAPLVRLPTLTLGDFTVDGHVACVADLGSSDGPDGFAGILGLGFFEPHPITFDPIARTLTIGDDEAGGETVALDVHRDGVSVSVHATVVLPSGREIDVEVDTGSESLILDPRFMADCGIDCDDPSIETKTGTDETGFSWTRRWVTIPGAVRLAGAPTTAQQSPRVMFQEIIYDGLIGADYLDRYRTTFDVARAQLRLTGEGLR